MDKDIIKFLMQSAKASKIPELESWARTDSEHQAIYEDELQKLFQQNQDRFCEVTHLLGKSLEASKRTDELAITLQDYISKKIDTKSP